MRMNHKTLGGTMMAMALLAGLSQPALAQAADIDFGDDTSEWANDGECDDPRFTGEAMAAELEDADILKDATDCRTAFEAGTITLAEEPSATVATPPGTTVPPATEIDFGDDSSNWANDGECDDPRFTGEGMAQELEDIDLLKDATDCQALFEEGKITLAEPGDTSGTTGTAAIDFGDDSSEWAKDDECDDPRFVGEGMAENPEDADIGRDATDCEAAFNAGTIRLADDVGSSGDTGSAQNQLLAAIATRIDFGDDSGDFPNDGECDDPDFTGSGMAASPIDSDRLRDASDCRAAFLAGTISFKSAASQPADFDYGSDYSQWANDGECDDWRFTGSAMAKKLSSDDVMADASDCRALEAAGEVSIKPVYQPSYALGAPYDSSNVDFGDNSSSYANDDICDDPRFEGPGTATTLLDSDRRADANDCRAAFEAGTVTLREGEE